MRRPRARDPGHAAHVHEDVGLRERGSRRRRTGAVPAVGAGVPESPGVGETVGGEEGGGDAHAVIVVAGLHDLGAGYVGGGVIGAVFIEEDVAAESPQAGQEVQRLPRVAPERIAHEIAGEHDQRRAHAHPASASKRPRTRSAAKASTATARAAAQRRG